MTTPRERLAALPPLSKGAHEDGGRGGLRDGSRELRRGRALER